MTPRQRRFVDEYLIDLNATRAARRAGYAPRYADRIAANLMGKNGVLQAIAQGMQERSKRTAITADQVVEELACIAFATITQVVQVQDGKVRVVDTDDLPPEVSAAIAEIRQSTTPHGGSLAVRLFDKVAALKLLGDHLGLFRKVDGGTSLPPVMPELGHDAGVNQG